MAWKRSVRNSSVLGDANVVASLVTVISARYELPSQRLRTEAFQLPGEFGQTQIKAQRVELRMSWTAPWTPGLTQEFTKN
jgi:hypothetical protein